MNLTIIGTSHIAKQSINEIKKAIEENKPDIVAVELDINRASALLHGEKNRVSLADMSKIGLKGYLFVKIGQYIQQKLGNEVGISPGSEMKIALKLAQKNKSEVSFIDQPIETTLKNFSKELTWKEKGRFVVDLVIGIIFPKKQAQKLGLDKFDLSKVPAQEVIAKMMNSLKKDYPSVYKTLVEDRNKYMVEQLVKLMRTDPNKRILAVVGAGHKEGMEKLLLKVDVVKI